MFRAALVGLALLALPFAAHAQTVLQQPLFVPPATGLDLGNGPTEIKMITGSMAIATSQGSGIGQTSNAGSSTAVILTATPLTPPLVGGIISGAAITSGTTVTAYSGTSITLSAAMSVATATTLSWGSACPSTRPTAAVALVQAGVGGDLPLYTQARICVYGVGGPGGQFLNFVIGAH